MAACLVCSTEFQSDRPDAKLCGGGHCARAVSAPMPTPIVNRSVSENYLRAISFFLRAIWIAIVASVWSSICVSQFMASETKYQACLLTSYSSSDCSHAGPIWWGILGLGGIVIFSFASMSAGDGMRALKEADKG